MASTRVDTQRLTSNTRWATLLQFHPQDDAKDGWGFGGVSVHGNNLDIVAPGSRDGATSQTGTVYESPLQISKG